MQLIPRYLLKNKVNILSSDIGYITEFVPVYARQIKIYKGIDNTLQFRLLNADQRPIDVSIYTPKFVVFDNNGKKVIDRDCDVNQIDDSSASRGLFTVTITENDMLNIERQYLRYNVYLIDSSSNKSLTYVDSHFDNNGTIFIDDYAFPTPLESKLLDTFIQNNSVWLSETISAEPGINGNEALHTISIYSNNYVGNVEIQATLENSTTSTNWATIGTVNMVGTETEPVPFNFNGVFNYIRLSFNSDPANTIDKVLIRN